MYLSRIKKTSAMKYGNRKNSYSKPGLGGFYKLDNYCFECHGDE